MDAVDDAIEKEEVRRGKLRKTGYIPMAKTGLEKKGGKKKKKTMFDSLKEYFSTKKKGAAYTGGE